MSGASVEVLDAAVSDVEYRAVQLLNLYAEPAPEGRHVPKRPKQSKEPWFLVDYRWFSKLIHGNSANTWFRCSDPGPLDNSSLLINPSKPSRLKPRLVENMDFVAVSEELWNKLHMYYEVKGPAILRYATSDGSIEFYPPVVKVSFTSNPNSNEPDSSAEELELEFSSDATLDDVCRTIETKSGQTIQGLKHGVYSSFTSIRLDEDNRKSTIRMLNWGAEVRLLAVVAQSPSATSARTSTNTTTTSFTLSLTQGHTASGSLISDSSKNIGDGKGSPGLGLCGLSNLGNTCYMNSVLQCLSHTTRLRAPLVSGDAQKRVNMNSKFGRKGEVVDQLAVLLRQMWIGKHKSVEPRGFKQALDSWTSMFRGYKQQDAHEFLAFILDGLHEDTNHGDPSNMPSLGEQLYTGRLCSTLTCPVCKTESKTSESYQVLSVDMPTISSTEEQKETKDQERKVLLVRPNGVCNYVPIPLNSPDDTAVEVADKLRSQLSVPGIALASIRSDYSGDYYSGDYRHLEIFTPQGRINSQRNGWSLIAFQFDEPVSESTLIHCVHRFEKDKLIRPFLCAMQPDMTRKQFAEKIESLFSAKLGEHFTLKTVHRSRKVTDPVSEMVVDDNSPSVSQLAYGVLIIVDWIKLPSEEIGNRIKTPLSSHEKPPSTQVSSGNKTESLKSRIEAFCAPEVLTGDDLWECPKCKEKRAAIKQISLDPEMPEVLILHLKRFNSLGQKLTQPVLYQACMNVNGTEFELTGIIRHHGQTITYGHYDAMVRSCVDEKWYNMNDSIVSPVPEVQFGKISMPSLNWTDPSAYIFFYTKRNRTRGDSSFV